MLHGAPRAGERPGGWPAAGGTDARSTPWSPGPRGATGETDPPIASPRVSVHRTIAAAGIVAAAGAAARATRGTPLEALPNFATGAIRLGANNAAARRHAGASTHHKLCLRARSPLRAGERPGGWPAAGGFDARSIPWSPGPRRATGETDPPIASPRVPVHRRSAAAGIVALPAADVSLVAMGVWAGAPFGALPGLAPGASTVPKRLVTSRPRSASGGYASRSTHPPPRDRPNDAATAPAVSAVDGRITHVTWINPPRREVPQA